MNIKSNEHDQIAGLLPLYVSGALGPAQRATVEQHLAGCAGCRADLVLWKSVSGEISAEDISVSAPKGLAERALAQVRAQAREQANPSVPVNLLSALGRILQLLRSQIPLVNREIWPASALVIALGYVVVLITARSGILYALAPLIAATCVSLIYGPESDPAYELSLSTPTSPRQILLARLVLVFGYNLALVLVATLAMLPMLSGQPLLGALALGWLAPMTFLSAAALVLSLWIGPQNAIAVTYLAWILELFVGPLRYVMGSSAQAGAQVSPLVAELMAAYQFFWQTPTLLFAAAVWMAGRQESGLLKVA